MNDYIEIRLEGGEFALPVEIGGYMEDKRNRGWWPATRQGEPPTRKCEYCGAEFMVNCRTKRFCSRKCQERARWRREKAARNLV